MGQFDPRHIGVIEAAYIMMTVGGNPASPSAGGRQQTQFRTRQVASSDEQHLAALQIEEHGQESHATLAPPTSGVDWNYFLYMSRSTPAKRKLFLLYCSATIEFSPAKAKGQRCIFSRMIPQQPSCVALTGARRLRSSKFCPIRAFVRPRWITSTRSRPRSSTFS